MRFESMTKNAIVVKPAIVAKKGSDNSKLIVDIKPNCFIVEESNLSYEKGDVVFADQGYIFKRDLPVMGTIWTLLTDGIFGKLIISPEDDYEIKPIEFEDMDKVNLEAHKAWSTGRDKDTTNKAERKTVYTTILGKNNK